MYDFEDYVYDYGEDITEDDRPFYTVPTEWEAKISEAIKAMTRRYYQNFVLPQLGQRYRYYKPDNLLSPPEGLE